VHQSGAFGEFGENNITLRVILFTNFDSAVSKYHTGVMSTTCDLPTDIISD